MLKLKEVIVFEDVTGLDYGKAMSETRTQLCQLHRLAMGRCKDCIKKPPCDKHAEQLGECETCASAQPSRRVISGLAFVVMKRTNPALTWDDFGELDYEKEIVPVAKGELTGERAAAASTSAGSPDSSTSSQRSRRTRSGV